MAILVIDGLTVAVSIDGVDVDENEIGGSRRRMLDGTMRQTVRTRKRQWTGTTKLLTASDYATFRAKLSVTPPLTCSGDVLGATTSCFLMFGQAREVWTKGQIRYRVPFTLFEQ